MKILATLLLCVGIITTSISASDFATASYKSLPGTAFAIIHSESGKDCKRITCGGLFPLEKCHHDHTIESSFQGSYGYKKHSALIQFHKVDGNCFATFYVDTDGSDHYEKIRKTLDMNSLPVAESVDICYNPITHSIHSGTFDDSPKKITVLDRFGKIAEITCNAQSVPHATLTGDVICQLRQSCNIQDPALLRITDITEHQKKLTATTSQSATPHYVQNMLLTGAGYGFLRMLYDIKCLLFNRTPAKQPEKEQESEQTKKLKKDAHPLKQSKLASSPIEENV